jgi:hypothetical protein
VPDSIPRTCERACNDKYTSLSRPDPPVGNGEGRTFGRTDWLSNMLTLNVVLCMLTARRAFARCTSYVHCTMFIAFLVILVQELATTRYCTMTRPEENEACEDVRGQPTMAPREKQARRTPHATHYVRTCI